ncbi:MAG TPA: TadE/TadG family type IV pilus assembly protein [Mycobacteriales bacterium]|nr:TadE/TadG family type IV pilus assembly protein [Mycobacteriales bacterium]
MHPIGRRPRGDGGAAAVEFALVSVLLLMLVFGIIGFGIALYRQQAASHGAREGARLAAVGIGTGNPTMDSCTEFENEVKSRAEGATITDVTLEVTDPAGGSLGAGDLVTVEVTHTVDLSIVGALVPGIPSTLTLTQTGKARVEVVGSVTSCA